MKKYTGIELLEKLSLAFGPSGCEERVREFIKEQISDVCDTIRVDRLGNLITTIGTSGKKKIMLSSHMDEVGFMINEVTDKGYLKFDMVGGIDTRVRAGDAVIASGAIRQDGTSREYAPIEFPAVPDTNVLFALVKAAQNLNIPYHTGVAQSKDSFYGQHSPSRMPTASALLEKWEAWKRLGVLASEMEASTLFTVGASLGIQTGAVFHVVWNQERANAGLDTDAQESHDTDAAIRVAVAAIRKLIEKK